MFILKIYFLFIKYSLIYLFFYSNDFYDNLLYDLANTNIIFIKIFQWLSSEKKFDNNFLYLLNKYCDNCPYNEECIDKKTLLELVDYSKNNNIDLSIDSFIPYRSGSINLVFKGKLNKKEIIIKILRKDIIKKIKESIIFFNNINKIFYIILYIFNLHNIIQDIIHKNKNILIDQANLKKEIENIKLFKNKYKKSNYLIIPNVYEDFSDKFDNLIVMDYIDGKTVDNINNNDINEFKKIFVKYNFSFLEKEIIHGDFHKGNILFCKINNEYKLGLIDFGIIFVLKKIEIDLIYKLFQITDIKIFLYTLMNFLKNNIDNNIENKNINTDKICDELVNCYKDLALVNNNLFDIKIIKHILSKLNDHNLIINERIANFIISISIINSFSLYFTNSDSYNNNKISFAIDEKFKL